MECFDGFRSPAVSSSFSFGGENWSLRIHDTQSFFKIVCRNHIGDPLGNFSSPKVRRLYGVGKTSHRVHNGPHIQHWNTQLTSHSMDTVSKKNNTNINSCLIQKRESEKEERKKRKRKREKKEKKENLFVVAEHRNIQNKVCTQNTTLLFVSLCISPPILSSPLCTPFQDQPLSLEAKSLPLRLSDIPSEERS